MPVPLETVRAVAVGVLARRLALSEVDVEQKRAAASELAHIWLRSPTDEDVPVRQKLRVALERREEPLRMVIAAYERHLLRRGVRSEHQHTREPLDWWSCPVVEERDRSVGMASCVVLPRESGSEAHLEVAPLAAQPPEDLLRLAGDLIDGVCVACGDQQVAARLHIDRVDVEVIVGRSLRAGLRLWWRRIRLGNRNLGIAVPLEQDSAGGDVELLHDPVPDAALLRTADRREIDR